MYNVFVFTFGYGQINVKTDIPNLDTTLLFGSEDSML